MPANHPIFQGTFLFGKKLLAVNISKNYQERHAPDGRGSTYECARKYWRLSKKRAEGVDYVIAVADGRVVGIYRPKSWSASKEVPGNSNLKAKKYVKIQSLPQMRCGCLQAAAIRSDIWIS